MGDAVEDYLSKVITAGPVGCVITRRHADYRISFVPTDGDGFNWTYDANELTELFARVEWEVEFAHHANLVGGFDDVLELADDNPVTVRIVSLPPKTLVRWAEDPVETAKCLYVEGEIEETELEKLLEIDTDALLDPIIVD